MADFVGPLTDPMTTPRPRGGGRRRRDRTEGERPVGEVSRWPAGDAGVAGGCPCSSRQGGGRRAVAAQTQPEPEFVQQPVGQFPGATTSSSSPGSSASTSSTSSRRANWLRIQLFGCSEQLPRTAGRRGHPAAPARHDRDASISSRRVRRWPCDRRRRATTRLDRHELRIQRPRSATDRTRWDKHAAHRRMAACPARRLRCTLARCRRRAPGSRVLSGLTPRRG